MNDYDALWEEQLKLPPHRLTWAEIDLDNLLCNLEGIKERVGDTAKIIGVVKADAYGHGIEAVQLLQDEGIELFAVAFIDEAIALRQNGIDRSGIILLGHTPIENIPDLADWDIEPAVYQFDFAKALSDFCVKNQMTMSVHLKVDTGMGRIGWRWDEAVDAIEQIYKLPGIKIAGIFTHFATADEADKSFTHLQLARYGKVIKEIEKRGIHIPLKHVENSAAILDFDRTIFNGVRPGIILYGLYPSDQVMKERISLKPVMRFKTTIVHIKTIHAGDSLGYGRAYIAKEDRRIATLPVGYADGYTRMLSGKGTEVWLHGKRAPVVGNICMDQCTIDITDIPEAQLYDEVELFGEHISADELAAKCGTINYEMVCMVNKRVPRIYCFMGEQHLEVEILNSGL